MPDLRCENCDQPVGRADLHIVENRQSENGIAKTWQGWSCAAVNWRERAISAEARVTELTNRAYLENSQKMTVQMPMSAGSMDVLQELARKRHTTVKDILDQVMGRVPFQPAIGRTFEPIDPDLGDLLTWEQFVAHVKAGSITSDDGDGELATATHVSNIHVSCVDVGPHYYKPDWATHVLWYNK